MTPTQPRPRTWPSPSINDCTQCETLAAAFQFVYGDRQELEFPKEGKAKLQDLKKRFKDLKHRDDLTLAELSAAITAIANEVAVVVLEETQVKAPGPPPDPTTTSTTAAPPSSTTTVITSSTTTAPPTTTSTVASTTSTTAPTTTVAPTSTTAAP